MYDYAGDDSSFAVDDADSFPPQVVGMLARDEASIVQAPQTSIFNVVTHALLRRIDLLVRERYAPRNEFERAIEAVLNRLYLNSGRIHMRGLTLGLMLGALNCAERADDIVYERKLAKAIRVRYQSLQIVRRLAEEEFGNRHLFKSRRRVKPNLNKIRARDGQKSIRNPLIGCKEQEIVI